MLALWECWGGVQGIMGGMERPLREAPARLPQPLSLRLMLRNKTFLSLAGLAALLLVAGCNVLDAAYDEGGSVSNNIEDAQHARATGDFATAERLLRDALDQEPGNAVVRTELSSTLMQREQINLLSLEGVTRHVLDEIETMTEGGAQGNGARGFRADSCTWNSSEPTQPFDPSAVEEYDEIVEDIPVLAEVIDLLNEPATPADPSVIPAALGELEPCTVIQDGTLVYDRDALLDEMRAHFDGDDQRVNAALTMNAIALTLGAYVDLFENDEIPVSWFIVGEEEDLRLGFCMDRTLIDPFYENVDGNLDAIAEAFFSLDLLIHNSQNEEYREYVDEALELYETFQESLGRFCE